MGYGNPSFTEEDEKVIDAVLEEIRDDMEDLMEADWNSGKYLLNVTRDADVQPVWNTGYGPPDTFQQRNLITSFTIETPEAKWEISREER